MSALIKFALLAALSSTPAPKTQQQLTVPMARRNSASAVTVNPVLFVWIPNSPVVYQQNSAVVMQ